MDKICTSLEQSNELIKLGIDLKTADMYWHKKFDGTLSLRTDNLMIKLDTPCWSLAALLGVLPEGIIKNYYVPNLQKENGKYSIAYGKDELLCIADNPVDACYEMIEKLHTENLI